MTTHNLQAGELPPQALHGVLTYAAAVSAESLDPYLVLSLNGEEVRMDARRAFEHVFGVLTALGSAQHESGLRRWANRTSNSREEARALLESMRPDLTASLDEFASQVLTPPSYEKLAAVLAARLAGAVSEADVSAFLSVPPARVAEECGNLARAGAALVKEYTMSRPQQPPKPPPGPPPYGPGSR